MTKRKPAPDTALEILVNVANSFTTPVEDGWFGVTLYVRGTVVTGRLIPNWQWMEEVAEQMQAATLKSDPDGDDEGERLGVTPLFDRLASEMKENRDNNEKLKDIADQLTDAQARAAAQVSQTTFLHLKDAKFFAAEHLVPQVGSHWRGRLSEVDGWSPGVLARS